MARLENLHEQCAAILVLFLYSLGDIHLNSLGLSSLRVLILGSALPLLRANLPFNTHIYPRRPLVCIAAVGVVVPGS